MNAGASATREAGEMRAEDRGPRKKTFLPIVLFGGLPSTCAAASVCAQAERAKSTESLNVGRPILLERNESGRLSTQCVSDDRRETGSALPPLLDDEGERDGDL